MKISLQFFALLFVTGLPLFGIEAQDIIEDERSMSLGMRNALTVDLPFATEDVAEDVWKDFVKRNGDRAKYSRRDKEFFADEVRFREIRDAAIGVYAKIIERGNSTLATFWFNMGDGFLSSAAYPDAYEGARQLLLEYLLEVEREMVKMELESEEDELKDMNRQLERLLRDLERYREDIEEAKQKIAETESKIENTLDEQRQMETAIEVQQATIDEVKKKLSKIGKNR